VNRQILFYGNSVILGSIGASLRQFPGFDVTTLAPPLLENNALGTINPDVVLFDLDASTTEPVFDLLKTNPALVLIGVNPGSNVVRIWNSQQLQEISMQDLLELLEKI
jgi:hypothetical protein